MLSILSCTQPRLKIKSDSKHSDLLALLKHYLVIISIELQPLTTFRCVNQIHPSYILLITQYYTNETFTKGRPWYGTLAGTNNTATYLQYMAI